MKAKALRLLCAAALAVLAAGCATPDARIRKNPALFAGFPPEVQEKVRRGAVEIGFTADMVYVALGRPVRVYDRFTAEGQSEVWSYVDTRNYLGGLPMTSGSGAPGASTASAAASAKADTSAFIITRVEFRGGKVIAIDRLWR